MTLCSWPETWAQKKNEADTPHFYFPEDVMLFRQR